MDVVIDVQFIKNSKNEYIPKEVAIVCLENNFIAHWIVVTPPCKNLPSEIKRQNTWLLKNFHGLDYYDGEVSLRSLNNKLKEYIKKILDKFICKVFALNKSWSKKIHVGLEYEDLEDVEFIPTIRLLGSDHQGIPFNTADWNDFVNTFENIEKYFNNAPDMEDLTLCGNL
ncbi:hypothetical protein TKK_0017084 [Trichogramma kaykai]